MTEPTRDELRRRAESGTPRGADVVWTNAIVGVRRLRRRRQVGAGFAIAATVVALAFLVGGDDGDDTTEVVSPATTERDPSVDVEAVGDLTSEAERQPRALVVGLVDVLLMDFDAAVRELESVGLVVDVVVAPVGTDDVILASSPPPGAPIIAGETVAIVAGPVPIDPRQTPMRAALEDRFLWTWDGEAGQRAALRSAEIIAECMAQRGLLYEVWVQPPLEEQIGVVELARDGWGLVRRLIDGPEMAPMHDVDPNLVYLDSLAEGEKGAYGVTVAGCRDRAEAWQSPFNLEQQDLVAEVFDDLGADFATIDNDPAVLEGRRRYFACITDAYGVEIDQFFEEYLIADERLDDFTARHGEDSEAWSQDALDELTELERFEHEVAFTVVACITEHYNPVRDAVAVLVEETMLETYADFLADLEGVVERALG